MPNRRKLWGVMLDDFYEGVRAEVLGLVRLFLERGGRMTLIIDAWEDVNHAHVVNFLAVMGNATVFLDSVSVGDVNQTAEKQAENVQSILDSFGEAKAFEAVCKNNTQSCVNMRESIVHKNPGMV